MTKTRDLANLANGVTSANIVDGAITNVDVNNSAGITSSKFNFTQSGTGATTRTVESKLRDVVSVKDFGAVGDWNGSSGTDDTAAIAAAFTACSAGQILYFPPGSYRITDTFTISKQIHLLGDGWDSSAIYFDATDKACIEFSVNPFGSKIEGLTISSVAGKDSVTDEVGIKGRENGSNRQLTVDRCYVTGFSLFGIMLHLGWNCQISNCEIRDCGNAVNGGGGVIVYDANGGTTGSTGHLFTNNYVAGCYNGYCSGSAVSGYSGYSWNNTFVLNIFEGCTYPINFVNGGRNTFIKHYQEANSNPSVFNSGVFLDFISITSGVQTFTDNSVVLDKDRTLYQGVFQTDDTDFALKPLSRVGSQVGTSGPVDIPIVRGKEGKFVYGSSPYTWDGQYIAVSAGQDSGADRDNIPGFATIATDSSAGADQNVGQFVAISRDNSGPGSGSKGGLKVFLNSNLSDSYLTLSTSDTSNNDVERIRVTSTGILRPATDDTVSLGTASYKWSEVFAGAGAINTSDINEKQDIEVISEAEAKVASSVKSLFKKFKFKRAVAEKGEKARTHFGVIAQEIAKAFADQGLDAEEYGLFCKDIWYEYNGVPVPVNANNKFVEKYVTLNGEKIKCDEDGNYPEDSVLVEVEHETVKKEILGIRYDELYAFLFAAG